MARAVGMRRSELVGAFATEGWIYALVATVLGVAAGIGLGAVLVSLSARIFATEHNRFDLFFTLQAAEPGAVVRDRLRRRARDDRRHEPSGQPAQHHPRDPRPRGAAASPDGALAG